MALILLKIAIHTFDKRPTPFKIGTSPIKGLPIATGMGLYAIFIDPDPVAEDLNSFKEGLNPFGEA